MFTSSHKLSLPTLGFLSVGLILSVGTLMRSSKLQGNSHGQESLRIVPKLPDTLRAVTLSGATTYFRYRDEGMGYQWELAKSLAEYLQRPLYLYIAPNEEAIDSMLARGEVNLCITPRPISQAGKAMYQYVGLESLSGLVLVQPRRRQSDSLYIHNVVEMLGKKITILANGRLERRLSLLESQLGGKMDTEVLHADSLSAEDLIAGVADGSYQYTIADSELAHQARAYYPTIDASLEVGFVQRLKWTVPLHQEELASAIDKWAAEATIAPHLQQLYRKYFESLPDVKSSNPILAPSYHLGKGDISPFDTIFKSAGARLNDNGWKWELLASIAYQESRFQPQIIGWSGARGLMGIMPQTGRRFGADAAMLLNPTVAVRVAVDVLLATERAFRDITDPDEKLKLTLAAYNAGVAHIQDAQRLATKYGVDPHIWHGNVEEYVRLKSDAKYYNDPVCKYGYMRGKETVQYVEQVTERYHQYLKKAKSSKR